MQKVLRPKILDTLRQDGEIVSIFKFLCDVGYFNYGYGLYTFWTMRNEGLITMTRTAGRGCPWRVTENDKCKTLVSGSVDCSVASRP